MFELRPFKHLTSGSLVAGIGVTDKGDLLKEHLSGRSCLNNNNKGRRKEPRKTVRVLVESSLGVAHRARRTSERLRGKAKVSLSYFCVSQEGVYLPGLDDFPCLSWGQAAVSCQ